jgi:hypothetical protein
MAIPIVAAILVLANIFCSWAIGPIKKQVLGQKKTNYLNIKKSQKSNN